MNSCKEKTVTGTFKRVGKSTLDSRNRITLSTKIMSCEPIKEIEINSFEIFIDKEGDILLCPLSNIPSKELWVHQNPQVKKKLQDGLNAAKRGDVTRVNDLDTFFEEL